MFDVEGFVHRNFYEIVAYGNPVTDLRVNCPFCDSDYKQHLYISLVKQSVHCFKCDYKNSWLGLVQKILHCSYVQAIGELYYKPKMVDFGRITQREEKVVVSDNATLPLGFVNLLDDHTVGSEAVKAYVHKRKFREYHIKKYNLGYASSIPNRVIIPIENDYWQARAVYKWMEPRYLNPKITSRTAIFNAAALYSYNEVVICEGAFSAMAVGDNAIALISKNPTHEKLLRIAQSPADVFIIALEYGAFGSMGKLADDLVAKGHKVIIWKFKQDEDPASSQYFSEISYDFKARARLLLTNS